MAQDILFAIDDTEEQTQEDAKELDTTKYLLFATAQLLFGVSSEYVVEIITNHTITKLPLVPRHVRGIINLRGQIIPIVDTRMLLGNEGEDDQCIIILNIDDTMVGILVDSVQKMMDIDEKAIRSDSSHKEQVLVSGLYSLPDGQTVLIFDCFQFLNQA